MTTLKTWGTSNSEVVSFSGYLLIAEATQSWRIKGYTNILGMEKENFVVSKRCEVINFKILLIRKNIYVRRWGI